MDPRPATAADLPAIREVVGAAYAGYLSRMDRPPAPMLADYGAALDAGQLWVTGRPVTGLIELTEAGGALHVGNVAVHPGSQGTGLGRLLMVLLGLGSLRDATFLFRGPNRLTP